MVHGRGHLNNGCVQEPHYSSDNKTARNRLVMGLLATQEWNGEVREETRGN